MTLQSKGIMETVIGESIRNWLVDGFVDWGLPEYRINPETGEVRREWLSLVWYLQNHPKETRSLIIAGSQSVFSLINAVPLERLLPTGRFPVLTKAVTVFKSQTGEVLEQLPDSMRAWANAQRVEFPEGFKPISAREAVQAFYDWLKTAGESFIQNCEALLRGRIPILERLLQKFHRKDDQASRHGHLDALKARKPELMGEWLAFVGKLPDDAEDDYHRVDGPLSTEGVIESILEAEKKETGAGVKIIKRLAEDSLSEKIGRGITHFSDAADKILDASATKRKKLDEERAARRAARRTRGAGTAPPSA